MKEAISSYEDALRVATFIYVLLNVSCVSPLSFIARRSRGTKFMLPCSHILFIDTKTSDSNVSQELVG